MTEVNLVKRFYLLVLITLALGGVSACTRDKPAEPTPSLPPRTVVAVSSASAASPATAATPVVVPAPPVIATVEITSTPVIIIPPSATPPPTPTQAPLPGTSNAPGTYTVKWGDWLNKIAAENNVTVQAILAANPGLNPNLIYPGQTINIPAPGGASPSASSSVSPPPSNPSTYTVQRGEWIYAIARRFGVSVPALLAANPGVNPNFLVPGQVLNIPGAGTTSAASSSAQPGTGGTYTVKSGDTLFSIAVKFRTTTYALQIKNNLANPHFIYPGQVLQIP